MNDILIQYYMQLGKPSKEGGGHADQLLQFLAAKKQL